MQQMFALFLAEALEMNFFTWLLNFNLQNPQLGTGVTALDTSLNEL